MIWLLLSILSTSFAQQQILPQCTCIPDPTGRSCLQYDSRFQAATLEEAMASFPDLSIEKNDTAASTTEEKASCTSQKCLDCQNDIRHKLKEIGLMPIAINEVFSAQANLSSTCDEYRFARKDEGVYGKKETHEEEEEEDLSSSEEEEEEEREKREKKDKKERKREKKERKEREEEEEEHNDKRRKRQIINTVSSNNTNVIGQRFTLSCSAKGVTTDVTGLVSLCSYCWVWRKLPDNYTPQYINELVCDDSDNACLSGYASCGVGHREIEVVRDDNGVKTTVALTAGSYCECKVSMNSALTSLVSGSGIATALPAVPAAGK